MAEAEALLGEVGALVEGQAEALQAARAERLEAGREEQVRAEEEVWSRQLLRLCDIRSLSLKPWKSRWYEAWLKIDRRFAASEALLSDSKHSTRGQTPPTRHMVTEPAVHPYDTLQQ